MPTTSSLFTPFLISLSVSLLLPTPFPPLVRAASPLSSIPHLKETTSSIVPNGFVVEFAQGFDVTSHLGNERRSPSPSPHEQLYTHLRKRGAEFTVRNEYDAPGLFTGSAILLKDPEEINAVAKLEGVVAIRPIIKVPGPKPMKKTIVKSPKDEDVPPDSQSTHRLIGVDKLHARGVTGSGIKIGIIDTGIDYTHPSLGSGFGPSKKVAYGYDFVGDDYDGNVGAEPDDDPLDTCNGHGTHVAGIIGADPGNEFGISGVAYKATLGAYRVFGCAGFVTDDVITAALLRGVSDGMDVLNLSLGGVDGWTTSTTSVVASRIAASGKTVVNIAAGNDGEHGSWFSASPGNAIDAISVASLDNTLLNVQNASVSGVSAPDVQYFSLMPLTTNITTPLRVYATSNDTDVVDDACNTLPDSTPDLSDRVVVIRRGTCSFLSKLGNASNKGGKVFLIYNNVAGLQGIEKGGYAAALISAETGEFLVEQYASGVPIALTFPPGGKPATATDPNGGLISAFTSYGPTFDMFFKPAIAAPGGNILSTYPTALGSFAVLSGTSMATPAMSGSVALVLSVRGKNKANILSMRDLLQTTAQPVASNKSDDAAPFQTLSQQGAGLIDVNGAAYASTIVRPGQLTLNDTEHFEPVQKFKITNKGKSKKTFRISHEAAGTMQSIKPGSISAAVGPVPLTKAKASVSFSQSTVTLYPGETKSITATFRPPQLRATEKATYPVYSGWIVLKSTSRKAKERETLRVAYMGVANALKTKTILDTSSEFIGVPLPAVLDKDGNPQTGPGNYTFVGADFPALILRMVFGSPRMTIDLIDKDTKFIPTISLPSPPPPPGRKRGFSFPGLFSGWIPHSSPSSGTYKAVKIIGPIAELSNLPRNSDSISEGGWNTLAINPARFANGTAIMNGDYRFLVRVLRVGGDRKKEEDYESWLSPVIGVRVGNGGGTKGGGGAETTTTTTTMTTITTSTSSRSLSTSTTPSPTSTPTRTP